MKSAVKPLATSLALGACGLLASACGTLDTLGSATPYERQAAALRAYQSGADAEAEALYLGLIRMAPNDPEHLLRLGNLYARSGRPDRAAESYTEALLLAPGDGRLWYNLGLIRQRQARAALIEAHAQMPEGDARRVRVEALSTCLDTASATSDGIGDPVDVPFDATPDALPDASPDGRADAPKEP